MVTYIFICDRNNIITFHILISIDYLLYFHISYLQKNLGGRALDPFPRYGPDLLMTLEVEVKILVKNESEYLTLNCPQFQTELGYDQSSTLNKKQKFDFNCRVWKLECTTQMTTAFMVAKRAICIFCLKSLALKAYPVCDQKVDKVYLEGSTDTSISTVAYIYMGVSPGLQSFTKI